MHWIDLIMGLLRIGEHQWYIQFDGNIRESLWYKRGRKNEDRDFCEFLRKSEQNSFNSSPQSVINVSLVCDGSVSKKPMEAFYFLREPLYVILENAESDGAFVEMVIQKTQKKHSALLVALQDNRLRFSQAGGKNEVLKIVTRHLSQGPRRLFVLIDGDGYYPRRISSESQKISDQCLELGVPCLVTRKREIENYIPERALKSFCLRNNNLEDLFAVFLELKPEQKDYYDMKNGFKSGEVLRDHDEHEDLFNDLSDEAVDVLVRGFGRKVWQAFQESSIKSKDVFNSSRTEIDTIVNQLFRLI